MILFYDCSLSLSWIFFLAVQNGSQLPANDLGLPLPHQQRRAVPCKAKAESITVLLGGGSAGNMLALRPSSTLSKPANWRWICKDLPFHESGEQIFRKGHPVRLRKHSQARQRLAFRIRPSGTQEWGEMGVEPANVIGCHLETGNSLRGQRSGLTHIGL